MPNDATKIASQIDKTEKLIAGAESDLLKNGDRMFIGLGPLSSSLDALKKYLKSAKNPEEINSLASACLKYSTAMTKSMEKEMSTLDKSHSQLLKGQKDLKKLKDEMKKLVALP